MENLKIALIPKACFGPCHTSVMETSIFAQNFVTDAFDKVLNTPLLIYDTQSYINLAINIRTDNTLSFFSWIYCYEHIYCYEYIVVSILVIYISLRDNQVSVACRKPTFGDIFYNFDRLFSISYKFALIFQ